MFFFIGYLFLNYYDIVYVKHRVIQPYWSRRIYVWVRAKHFDCHYPRIGISSEGIVVVLCVSVLVKSHLGPCLRSVEVGK